MWPLLCGSGGSENNIEELRGLRLLRGSLHIRTTGVAHHIDDVEKEVLTNKTNLSKLRIYFELYSDDSDEQLLRILKPPSNIEELVIGRYGGRRFPEWMEKMRSFPRLRRIKFAFMWNVEEWGLNWRHKEKEGEECFPSLQHLKIRTCWNLKALPQELGNLTSLETLSIRQCYELVSVPQLQLHLMTSLKKLVISVCPKLKFVFHGLRHLTSLQYLSIRDCPGVEIPKGNWTNLLLFGVHPFSTILIRSSSVIRTQQFQKPGHPFILLILTTAAIHISVTLMCDRGSVVSSTLIAASDQGTFASLGRGDLCPSFFALQIYAVSLIGGEIDDGCIDIGVYREGFGELAKKIVNFSLIMASQTTFASPEIMMHAWKRAQRQAIRLERTDDSWNHFTEMWTSRRSWTIHLLLRCLVTP
ncbi:hypothetical protein Sjap_011314 [Stephania japonica]|uniref:Uncharacterized protein n=1 Tax=Stephania japonica TaxID=461633 RepID=A0AAP0JAW4_9MAGN